MSEQKEVKFYPLTIVYDRYTGVYSGGKYTAWNLLPWEVPKEIDGDDVECRDFWYNNLIPVGVGDTPEKAVENLKDKFLYKVRALAHNLAITEGRIKYVDNIYKIEDGGLFIHAPIQGWEEIFEFEVIETLLNHLKSIVVMSEKLNLTEQQLVAIKGRIAEGTMWAAIDTDCPDTVKFFDLWPEKCKNGDDYIFMGSYPSISENLSIWKFMEPGKLYYLPDILENEECDK